MVIMARPWVRQPTIHSISLFSSSTKKAARTQLAPFDLGVLSNYDSDLTTSEHCFHRLQNAMVHYHYHVCLQLLKFVV